MSKNELKPIEIPQIEILDDTPEEIKLDYFFKCLAKEMVDLENLKIEIKDFKKDMKNNEIDVPRLSDAIKYKDKDGINKKSMEADTIDIYMEELQKLDDGEENQFKGMDSKFIRLLELETELKENIKIVKDKIGEVGLDKKAIPTIAEEFITEHNPNKKVKGVDIVLEKTIDDYNKSLKQSKKDITPIPIKKEE